MSLPLDHLEAEILDLPPHERARLAHRLIVSLDDDVEEDPAEQGTGVPDGNGARGREDTPNYLC